MYEGYKQIQNPPKELNWSYAERWRPENQPPEYGINDVIAL